MFNPPRFGVFKGTRKDTNLAKDLRVPVVLIRRHLTCVHTERNPRNHLEMGYYKVDEAKAFFASDEGKAAIAAHKAAGKDANVTTLENCLMRWTTFRPGGPPLEHEGIATKVRLTERIATFWLEDGTRIRKTRGSCGFEVVPLPKKRTDSE